MKKKSILLFIGIAIFFATFNLNLSVDSNEKTLPLLSLANIEALAQNENGGVTLDCWNTITNDRDLNNPVLSTHVTYCGSCKAVLVTSYSSKSTCRN